MSERELTGRIALKNQIQNKLGLKHFNFAKKAMIYNA